MQGKTPFSLKNLALWSSHMYRFDKNRQAELTDFNQPLGMKLNPDNRWVKKADMIPWDAIEEKYAEFFPSKTGMPAKPLRVALGSLMIQKEYEYSDRELIEQIRENPYYQYFIGLPKYQDQAPFVPSLLVEFRKRISDDVLVEVNEMIVKHNIKNSKDDDHKDAGGNGDNSSDSGSGSSGNNGTLILDATCAPQNISYPQDVNLLNEARENLEAIIDKTCYEYHYEKPRLYRRNARKDYLNLAKCKKRTSKKIRKAIKKQLAYVYRDLLYVRWFVEEAKIPYSEKTLKRIKVIDELFDQQEYMYKNKVHSVKDRIVSISQPYIRPIVRGKAKAPVEFGAKLDMSIDENGIARLEKLSFDAYNEADVLITAIQRYRERTGHYPERVLVDQIYRNQKNRAFCKEHGIRISGPALGRPKEKTKEERKQEYADNTDRIEVERDFSLAKRSYGLGLIRTKLDDTTRSSIALSILVMNLNQMARILLRFFAKFIFLLFGSTLKGTSFMLKAGYVV